MRSTPKDTKYHLVLVHGTAAREAPWTREETSSLCKHLRRVLGDDISFSPSDWSGRNTHNARAEGAEDLLKHVRDEVPEGRRLVLVGHSHGGTVIAQALVKDADLCSRLAGAIFLATPFLHARPLPMARHVPKGPALLAGLVCAAIFVICGIVVLAAVGGPAEASAPLVVLPFVLTYLGLFVGWWVAQGAGQLLGVSAGELTPETRRSLSDLIAQVDVSVLEQRAINRKALLLRSTADEAAGGLATAQILGRIASDAPALAWKTPWRLARSLRSRIGFGGDEPPTWFVWGFGFAVVAVFLGFVTGVAAALFPRWEVLQSASAAMRTVGDDTLRDALLAFVYLLYAFILALLLTVPLVIIGLPLKILSSFFYGIRGWPIFKTLFIELSVEPAPPGKWLVHQLDASSYEGVSESPAADGSRDTVLAHSFVYDDARAHRSIEEWLKRGCQWF